MSGRYVRAPDAGAAGTAGAGDAPSAGGSGIAPRPMMRVNSLGARLAFAKAGVSHVGALGTGAGGGASAAPTPAANESGGGTDGRGAAAGVSVRGGATERPASAGGDGGLEISDAIRVLFIDESSRWKSWVNSPAGAGAVGAAAGGGERGRSTSARKGCGGMTRGGATSGARRAESGHGDGAG